MKLCSEKLIGKVIELYIFPTETEELDYIFSGEVEHYVECKIRLTHKGQNEYVELKETKYSFEDLVGMDITVDMNTGKITGKIEKKKSCNVFQ